jgi:uncharacterized protein YegP (UPF0339 family)
MAGKFVIRTSGEEFYFVLKAGNGEIIATSERYASKASAENGIESVRDNAADAPIEDETAEPVDVLA